MQNWVLEGWRSGTMKHLTHKTKALYALNPWVDDWIATTLEGFNFQNSHEIELPANLPACTVHEELTLVSHDQGAENWSFECIS